MGSGFRVINYPTIENKESDDPEEWYLDVTPEAEIEIAKILNIIKQQRGETISRCVDVDNLLGRVISDFFLKDDPQKREIFHELILDTTILSFSQKKRIFKTIVEKYSEKKGISSEDLIKRAERDRKLFEDLNHIIKIRNALAHGNITLDFESGAASLQYFDSNKNEKTETIITPQFFEDLKLKLNNVVWLLWSSQFHSVIVENEEDKN